MDFHLTIFLSFRRELLFGGSLANIIPSLRDLGLQDQVKIVDVSIFSRGKGLKSDSDTIYIEPNHLTGEETEQEPPNTAVSDFLNSSRYQGIKLVVLQMLGRNDLTGTFRNIDREALFISLTNACIHVLESESPAIVVFDVTPHMPGQYLLYEISRALGIKTLFFQPCSFAPAMLPRTTVESEVRPRSSNELSESTEKFIANHLEISIERAVKLSDPPYMEEQSLRDGRARSVLGTVRSVSALLRWLAKTRYPDSVDFSGMYRIPKIVKNVTQIVISSQLASSLRRKIMLLPKKVHWSGEKFEVFFLHYEPERTVTPEGGLSLSQAELVNLVYHTRDKSMKLVIKEHPSQVSGALRGFLGRSISFYDQVASLKEAVVVGPDVTPRSLIADADRVLTMTGTIGIEATLSGAAVSYFGYPWWQGIPGAEKLQFGSAGCRTSSRNQASKEEVVAFLRSRILEDMIPGITSEEPSRAESRWGPLGEDFWEDSGHGIAREIWAVIKDTNQR
ncbi:hypothetical protein N9M74_00410 [Pontimonas sp.]|nr:hypothetical protein [Pontimonas sp.]